MKTLGTNIFGGKVHRLVFTLLIGASLFSGCASTDDKGTPKPGYLSFTPLKNPRPGYGFDASHAYFEDKDVRITVTQFLLDPEKKYPWLLVRLCESGFVALKMTIISKTDKLLIYNPAITALIGRPLSYEKPIEYTELYEIVRGMDEAETLPEGKTPERLLAELKRYYYDLNTRVAPGNTTTKLLIFRQFRDRVRSADLIIKEFYIGVGAIELDFPFRVKLSR